MALWAVPTYPNAPMVDIGDPNFNLARLGQPPAAAVPPNLMQQTPRPYSPGARAPAWQNPGLALPR